MTTSELRLACLRLAIDLGVQEDKSRLAAAEEFYEWCVAKDVEQAPGE